MATYRLVKEKPIANRDGVTPFSVFIRIQQEISVLDFYPYA